MARQRYFDRELLPLAAMVTVEFTNVGLSTIYKAAVSKGLSYHVFMVYSNAISALVVLPLIYLCHRKTDLPPLSLLMLGKFFMLGALGFSAQYIGYLGIAYSNPTMGSAMSNLTPATTFFLAILFRMEKLKLKSSSSQAKTIGTVLSIAGAFTVVLYKGPILISADHTELHVSSNSIVVSRTLSMAMSGQSNWILGGALLAVSYMIISIWYIFQTKYVNEYPAELVVSFFYNLFACSVALPVCIFSEPNLNAWIVPSDIRLLSVLYSGIIGSGFGTVVHTWGLHVKGPVYVAMFKPLSIAIAAIFGVIFLSDDLFLGSIVGSVVISMGFYTVIWGKMKEDIIDESEDYDNVVSSSEDLNFPLLKHHIGSTKENADAKA